MTVADSITHIHFAFFIMTLLMQILLLVLPFVALDTPHPRTVRVLWKATPLIKINDFQRLKAINI